MAGTVQKIVPGDDWYGKYEAMIMSAVAILLMVWHHMFGFRDYLADGNGWNPLFSIHGIEAERMLAAFGKICVGIFAFNSGYVMWKRRDQYKSVRQLARRGVSFLVSYWLVFALFMLYGAATSSPLPEGRDLALNLFGLSTGPHMPYVNVTFAWYVAYYLVFLVCSPLLIALFSGNRITDLLLVAATLAVPLPSFMSPLPMGCLGIVFSKYGIFTWLGAKTERFGTVALGAFCILLAVARQGSQLITAQRFISLWGGVDLIIVPLFIVVTVTMIKRLRGRIVRQTVEWLATAGMFIWFLHGIFFTGTDNALQKLAYASCVPLLCYVTLLAICLPVAFLLTKARKLIPV